QSDTRYGFARVVHTGRSELIAEITPEMVRPLAKSEEQLRLLEDFNLHSAVLVPLVARQKTLGAIGLTRGGAKPRFTAGDLALAEELAVRAAVAIENAQLYATAQQEQQEAQAALAVVRRK